MKSLAGKINEEGVTTYLHMIVALIGTFIITALHSNSKLSKDIRHFGIEPKKGVDTQQVKDDERIRAIFGTGSNSHFFLSNPLSVEKEYTRPLADDFVQAYQELSSLLKGELGTSLLASFDLTGLARLMLSFLRELLDPSVCFCPGKTK